MIPHIKRIVENTTILIHCCNKGPRYAISMKLLLAAVLILAIPCAAISAAEPIPENAPAQQNTSSLSDEVGRILDYNAANNIKNGFSPHRPNYLLPITTSNYNYDRDENEIKFQISVKQRFLRLYGWAWYIGYTQKSFWQAYDESESRPFRENNFNPETFMRTKMWNGWRFDLGLEHESNGESGLLSRSWNRIYFTPYYENKYIRFSLKSWYRIPEEEKENPEDTNGDDNPDIHKYYGYSELGLTFKIRDLYLSTMSRWNFRHKKGAFCLEATIPMYTNSMHWFIQYWEGYGESLIDYDLRQRKFGFGFMFTR